MDAMTRPRTPSSFNASRPFDATKDADLLDAMNDMLRVAHDCDIPGEILIELVRKVPTDENSGNAEPFAVQVSARGGDVFPQGGTVREAIQRWLNSE